FSFFFFCWCGLCGKLDGQARYFMPNFCAAVGCTNRYRRGCSVRFHHFPADPELSKQWVLAMRRDKFVPNKHSVLCSEHFSVGAYDDKVRLMNEMGMDVKTARLKRDAVPSNFLHRGRHLSEPEELT
ncbi:hypothetical protein HPB47_013727, partial [Ixodes persulcatus]